MLRCRVASIFAGFLVCCVPNERPDLEREPSAAASASANRTAKRSRPEKEARLDSRKRADAAARRAAAAKAVARDGQTGNAAQNPQAASVRPGSTSTPGALEYDFDSGQLGPDWNLTSPAWKLDKGRLCVQGARNHPAWLRQRIAPNARIEFDAASSSPDGDIKIEVWGDGKSAAVASSYTNASSYIVIFGGWKNSYHVLARIDEHAKNRPEVKIDANSGDLRAQPVVPDRMYHFKIERNDGKTVRWYVDDIEIIGFPDPAPLSGQGHEYLGFNNWETRVCFDNLQVVPL